MNTATLREKQPVHEVDFHGATLHISIDMDVFWLAADADGSVHLYEYSPETGESVFLPSDVVESQFKVADVDLDGINWRDTLIRVQV